MTNNLKEKNSLLPRTEKEWKRYKRKSKGAGVASVDAKNFMSSRKVTNVVGKINRTKIENLDFS